MLSRDFRPWELLKHSTMNLSVVVYHRLLPNLHPGWHGYQLPCYPNLNSWIFANVYCCVIQLTISTIHVIGFFKYFIMLYKNTYGVKKARPSRKHQLLLFSACD